MIRFVIRSSYGNDSVALIQWAHESVLEDVAVLYSDTGWARDSWAARVEQMEVWVKSLGFATARTSSIGMEALVRSRKMWPQRLMQFCTKELKILPTKAWLEENDPGRLAVILTGVRREESTHRAKHPAFILNSANDGGRIVASPLVDFTKDDRNALVARAGFDVLSHRSEECLCINSGRDDIKRWDENDIAKIGRIEADLGFSSKGKPCTFMRPNKHMGATGIVEIVKWANSPHGKYRPPTSDLITDEFGELPAEDGEPCDLSYCER